MKRSFLLVTIAALGACAPPAGAGGLSLDAIREAVRSELLAARPSSAYGLELKLSGAPLYLGTIDFTGTSKTNHEATTPFSNTAPALCGKTLLLQPTQAVHIKPTTTNTGAVTTANGVLIGVNERVIVTLNDYFATNATECWIAAIRSSASGDLKVWELR